MVQHLLKDLFPGASIEGNHRFFEVITDEITVNGFIMGQTITFFFDRYPNNGKSSLTACHMKKIALNFCKKLEDNRFEHFIVFDNRSSSKTETGAVQLFETKVDKSQLATLTLKEGFKRFASFFQR